MKYLVLRKRAEIDDDAFNEMVAAGASHEFQLPFDVKAQELSEKDLGDLYLDPNVEDVVSSMPFNLIAPVEEPTDVSSAQSAWGVEAVGATTSPWNGEGVTVAVLDTGIDTAHPAFSGVEFELMDFTVDEQGVAGSAPDNHGHGTHVAGTIFGRAVDGKRIGVSPVVKKVLIGKVLGQQVGPTEAVFNAIEWALKRRVDVISMSLAMDFPGLVTRLAEAGFPEDIAASRALEAYRSNVRLFDRLADLVASLVSRGRGRFSSLPPATRAAENKTIDSRLPLHHLRRLTGSFP
jgi:subtilisin family serine protease